MAAPLRFDALLSKNLHDALYAKVDRRKIKLWGAPYFALKTAEKALEEGNVVLKEPAFYRKRTGHVVITKAGGLYDYCAKKHYATFEAWYEDRGHDLLGLAEGGGAGAGAGASASTPLPPLSSELCFGRQGHGYLSYDEILAVIAKVGIHDDASCTCARCGEIKKIKEQQAEKAAWDAEVRSEPLRSWALASYADNSREFRKQEAARKAVWPEVIRMRVPALYEKAGEGKTT